jgi:hypothetical protein
MGGKAVKTALMMALLMVPGVAKAQGRPAIVITSAAGLYELPARSLGMKVEVPRQTPVQVLDEKGSWYVVRVADLVGWMQKHTLRVKESAPSSSRPSTERASTVRASTVRASTEKLSSKPPAVPARRSYVLTLKGDCYYWSQAGRKVFVDRSICS